MMALLKRLGFSLILLASSAHAERSVMEGTPSTGGSIYVSSLTQRVGISSTTPTHTLSVGGDINFSGNLYKNGVPFSSGSGAYVLKVGDTMTGQLNVSSNVVVVGSVTANTFYGDGSHLTGISGAGDVYKASTQTFTGSNTFTGSVTVSSLTVTGGRITGISNSSSTFITADYTTSATSFGPCIPGSTVTIATNGGRVNMVFSGSASHNSGSGFVWVTVIMDGSTFNGRKGLGAYQDATANVRGMITFNAITAPLSSGNHTFCLTARTQTGTANVRATADETAQFWVQELK